MADELSIVGSAGFAKDTVHLAWQIALHPNLLELRLPDFVESQHRAGDIRVDVRREKWL
jgi:hypothetical protein